MMSLPRTVLSLTLLLAPLSAHAAPSGGCALEKVEAGSRLERSVEVAGTTRRYLLDVPDSVSPKHPAPLVFFFHGFGHSAVGLEQNSGFTPIAASAGFITVYPDGLPVHLLGRDGSGWEFFTADNRDVAFVKAMLQQIESEYCIEPSRVYSTGFSNGGFFSNLLACEMADRIAAIAPVGGGRIATNCSPSRPVPVIIHHGSNDSVVPIDAARATRDQWAKLDGCGEPTESDGCRRYSGCRSGADVVYCENDGDHRWPPQAAERIWKFFEQHPLR